MSVQLVIELSEDVLKALVASRNLTITVTQSASGGGNSGSPAGGSSGARLAGGNLNPSSVIPREGSLNAHWTDGGLMYAPAFR